MLQKNQFKELQEQILNLQDKINELSKKSGRGKDGKNTDDLFEKFWRQIFYWNTFFESITGYTQTGTVAITGSSVTLTTGATSGNSSSIAKTPTYNSNLKYSVKSYFRSTVNVDALSGHTTYVIVGNLSSQYYGFKMTGGNIYAVSSNNGTAHEQAVLIGAQSLNQNTFEARFYPSNKITFYLNPQTTNSNGVAVNSVSIPISSETIQTNLMQVIITTNTNNARVATLSQFEILQAKNYNY